MIAMLPKSLEICGVYYDINSDYRNILRIFEAFNDNDINDAEKAYICLKRLYLTDIPDERIEEAIRKAYWFCDGGDIPKTKPDGIQTIDWSHDGSFLFPAVSKAAGVVDIRSLEYLHWWTFLGFFGEIGEGLFSTVVQLRRKLAEGRKLEKYELEFYERNKNLIIIRSPEEQAAVDETEAYLNELLGEQR